MTTISPKRRRASARSQLILIALAVVLAAVALFMLRSSLSGLVWRVVEPLVYARSAVAAPFGALFSGFASAQQLAAENAQLRAELASSTARVIDRNVLYAENLALKARLGRHPAGKEPLLAAILSRPPATPYDSLVIDVGSNDGVKVGNIVAASGSAYLGRVSEVYPTASRVLLFSAPGEVYEATLRDGQATSSLAISVKGQGGGSLSAEVPAGTLVRVGDQVLFPNLMPEIMAQVVAIDAPEQSSFKTIYMSLPVNPYIIRFVEVHVDTSLTTHAQ